MKYPSWKDFESKYPDYQGIAFEALARMLFRCRYELGDSLPYFKNHAGNETETIVVDGEEIGFQAKYFDNEINASLIEHSISLILPCTLEKSSPLNSYFSFKENADTLKSNKSFYSWHFAGNSVKTIKSNIEN